MGSYAYGKTNLGHYLMYHTFKKKKKYFLFWLILYFQYMRKLEHGVEIVCFYLFGF